MLVETKDFKYDVVDMTEMLPYLIEAVKKYGAENVQIRLSERSRQGYPVTCIIVCCYRK